METDPPQTSTLSAQRLEVGYGGPPVVQGVTAAVLDGQITAIVGANASGKSTLLRALARLLRPSEGVVYLNGSDISTLSTRSVATQLALLPQSPRVPNGVLVKDLVRRGRYPYQHLFARWSKADERTVQQALELTDLTELCERPVDELSGGQRQRVWIAMVLAQDTSIMLLDEPTTFLDIAHQIEMLDLLTWLNRIEGRTVVMVLHDLNWACRYASHLIAVADGRIEASGPPEEVVTTGMIERVFGLPVAIITCPVTGAPLCVPHTSVDGVNRQSST